MAEKISGVVDQIPYYNENTGWSIIKIVPEKDYPQAQDRDGAITVVGTMPTFKEGESVQFTGEWDNNRRYGMQFKVNAAALRLPKTEIVNYLSSSAVKGVGPVAAALIVDRFGEATIEILDEEPDRVYEIPSLKPEVVKRFLKDWTENHVQRHTLTYLQEELGLSGRLARRIYSKYDVDTRRLARTNPYQLAADDFISFKNADKIARKLGVLDDDRIRLAGGLLQALNDFARGGHTFAPRQGALARATNLLRLEDDRTLEEALNDLLNSEQLGEEQLEREAGAKPIRAIYLPKFWHAENQVAETLSAIAIRPSRLINRERDVDSLTLIIKHFHREGIDSPASEQISAVQSALTNKVSVLTGGPGTGKTATLRILASVLRECEYDFKLAAPTGRAARRLSDATENIASTIHRLLQWDPESGGFTYHQNNRLQIDVVIIDEASMLDLRLFNSLLEALPLSAHLMLVGDIGQLPSVGAGNVLSDVIKSGIAKVTRLNQIFRQEEGSHIVRNAHRIKQGKYPIFDSKADDFFFFKIASDEAIADMVVDIVKRRVPKHWDLDPAKDIQVIAPMKRGVIGVNNLNSRLQQALNGASLAAEVKLSNCVFRVGDKVMQTRNDYEKDVYNGDIGFIQSINTADKSLKIKFDYGDQGRFSVLSTDASEGSDLERFLEPLPDSDLITYQFSETENLTLAYCITVHKTQGSEFPVVVLPVHSQQSRMLQRNLLYTAITRAKQLVVLVGTPDALQKAVDSNDVTERHSGLLHRLRA